MARWMIDAATVESTPPDKPADHAAVADLGLDARRGLVDERGDGPVAGAAADVEREVAQQLGAAIGVRDLRVEQHGVVAALRRLHDGDRRVVAGGGHREAGRRRGDEVAVAGPHLQLVRDALQQPRRRSPAGGARWRGRTRDARSGRACRRACRSSAACRSRCPASARPGRARRGRSAARPLHPRCSGRPTGSMPIGRLGLDGVERRVEREYFAVHRQLAQTASDQLGKLRAEIQDDDGLVGHEISNER